MQRLLLLVWLAFFGVFPVRAQFSPHTQARLVLAAETAQPGQTVHAGIHLRMAPKWHTYWRHAGESGAPTEVKWTLPEGVSAGEIQWPLPERYTLSGLTTYVYHDEVVLLVPLTLGANVKPGPLELAATVNWLECEETCVPGSAEVSARLIVGDKTKPSADAALIEKFRRKVPQPDPAFAVSARWENAGTGDTRPFIIELPAGNGFTEADLYPYASEAFEVRPSFEKVPAPSGRLAVRKTVKKSSGDWPATISGSVVNKAGDGKPTQAVEASFTLDAGPPAAGGAAGLLTGSDAAPRPVALMLLLALAGGMILNLMPCVLPILSLKVLAVVKQRGKSQATARRHSLSYAAGVLVSFWFIAGLVVLGRLATWGEQFQDARFIVIVTALMTVVALNLFGVFEFVLPGRAVGAAAELSAREGASGAFFNGILAVVLGASCVAPLLAGAIGWAVVQPPVIILLTFTAIGLGLALPYVALTFFPGLQRILPRPGAWMERFKVAMGFPMLATAAWLFSLLPEHYGRSGVLWVGLFLVLLAAAAWVFGEFIQRGSRGISMAGLAVLAFLGFGYGFALEHKLDWRHPDYASLVTPATGQRAGGIDWQPWSAEAVAEARAGGRPVLVDFTANWCLTCQANKVSSIEIEAVRRKLKEINAVALLADYTRRSPAIRDELKRFGRAGVPLVLVYPRDPAAPPEILPTLLTPGIVLKALDKAAPKNGASRRQPE